MGVPRHPSKLSEGSGAKRGSSFPCWFGVQRICASDESAWMRKLGDRKLSQQFCPCLRVGDMDGKIAAQVEFDCSLTFGGGGGGWEGLVCRVPYVSLLMIISWPK